MTINKWQVNLPYAQERFLLSRKRHRVSGLLFDIRESGKASLRRSHLGRG